MLSPIAGGCAFTAYSGLDAMPAASLGTTTGEAFP
jgi:hypothetical protein